MRPLILYSTKDCHLCDVAKELIVPLLPLYGFELIETDIATRDALMQCYGVKIPVIFRPDNESELCWPFDAEQVQVFLGR